MAIHSEKLLIVGAYPPPTGGNSVHIKRLKEALCARLDLTVAIIDMYTGRMGETDKDVFRYGPPGVRALLRTVLKIRSFQPDILHVHVSAMERYIYVGYLLRSSLRKETKKIITIHSGTFIERYLASGPIRQYLIQRFLANFDSIVAVNVEQKEFIRKTITDATPITVIPAYIPPETTEDLHISTRIKMLRAKALTLVVTSGNGIPLYGFDTIMNALQVDTSLGKHIALIVCTYNYFDEQYMAMLDGYAQKNRNIVIYRNLNEGQFAYVLSQSDCYVRATDRDGDSVAIREANYYGLCVIASNVVVRPDYCDLFDRGDTGTLLAALRRIIDSPRETPRIKHTDCVSELCELYDASKRNSP